MSEYIDIINQWVIANQQHAWWVIFLIAFAESMIILGILVPGLPFMLMLGGLMAAPVFASSVVAMPLLLDRQLNTLQAVLTSWKVVLTHPMSMALWAFLIMGLSMMGILSLFIGLIVIVPMLGHASWHAYRDLVDTHDVPERMPRQEAV
jgi:uncharacterized membrane protein